MEYTQGSTYYLGMRIKENDKYWDNKEAKKVTFTFSEKIGNCYKTLVQKEYPSADVEFDEETKVFTVHLTREDTMKFNNMVHFQVQIDTITNETKQTPIKYDRVNPTLNKEIVCK